MYSRKYSNQNQNDSADPCPEYSLLIIDYSGHDNRVDDPYQTANNKADTSVYPKVRYVS